VRYFACIFGLFPLESAVNWAGRNLKLGPIGLHVENGFNIVFFRNVPDDNLEIVEEGLVVLGV
jgi:hypothetical protein